MSAWRHRLWERRWSVLALLAALLLGRLYLQRLDAYLINDDEGSYLYAAWRIALGEKPYCDFLTPQLPAFLYPGGFLMRWWGPDVWPARALAAGLTLGAGLWTYLTARRLFGPAAALLAALALLLQPEVFLHGRTYRSDPFMLAAAALGVYLFSRAVLPRPGLQDPPHRGWLAAAGAAFGLATLSKLFGPLPLAGCLLWLLWDARRRHRPWRALVLDGLACLLPCLLLVGTVMGAFQASGCQVLDDVVLHHTMQNQGQPWFDVLRGTGAFLLRALREPGNALLALPAFAAACAAWRRGDRQALFFACQLPTLLAFALLSREKYSRHLLYLVPALATLFALAVRDLARRAPAASSAPAAEPGRRAAGVVAAVALALLLPWALWNRDVAHGQETGTRSLAAFVQVLTGPDELLLSDYSELNFYALRPTTYAAASLSAGAAQSGQITWARLARELDGRRPPLVILDTDPEYAHTRFFGAEDRAALDAWLAEHYGPPTGSFQRDAQRYEVYAAKDRPLPTRARFRGGPRLLAAAPDRAQAMAGQTLTVSMAWQAPAEGEAPMTEDLGLTLRLIDAAGLEWAQADGGLFASDPSALKFHRRPTSTWRPEELAGGQLSLPLPAGLPAGSYDLVLGLYDQGGRSLDALNAEGSPLGQGLLLGSLAVEPWTVEAGRLPPGTLELDLRGRAEAGPLIGRGTLPAAALPAGAGLPLDLWWSVPAQGSKAGAGSLRLTLSRDQDDTVAADWQVDAPSPGPRAYLQRSRVFLPTEAAAPPGTYRLRAQWQGRDVDAVYGPGIELGTVSLGPQAAVRAIFAVPSGLVFQRLERRFGQAARLLGTDLPAQPSLRAGETLDLKLVWRAEVPVPVNYQVTVQLLDEAGQVRAQHDGPPAEGVRESATWLRDEVVVDAHRLETAGLAPGAYRLLVGLYHPLTGRRLAPEGDAGVQDGLLEIGRLRLEPPTEPDASP